MDSPKRGAGGKFLPKDPPPVAAAVPPESSGGSAQPSAEVPPLQVDPSAPLGRKLDGTPRRSRSGRPPRDAGIARVPRRASRVNPAPPGAANAGDLDRSRMMEEQARVTAEGLVSTVTGTAESLLGPLWKPEAGERAMLVGATTTYLRDVGMPDIPPGWVLLGVMALYIVPRALNPETQKQFAALMGKNNGARGANPLVPEPPLH